MLTIAKLFGKSPFAPLQTHMNKVASCVNCLPSLFQAIREHNEPSLKKIAEQLTLLEQEADVTNTDLRSHLPKSLFLPVNHNTLLEILDLQDSLADQAEKIALRSNLYPLALLEELQIEFDLFCKKNLEAFTLVWNVIKELDELLECSFGGIEAEKVKGMIKQVALVNYEVQQLEQKLTRKIYCTFDRLSPPAFHLWLTLIREIAFLASLCEQLGNRIRMLLELN
jgi:predicted phosphate transport protein (TIGR00153 family)